MYGRDIEWDVKQFNAAGEDPLVARIMLEGLFIRYGRERIQQELMRQSLSVGVMSIAMAPNWQRTFQDGLVPGARSN
jgi:hypothetical protein